MFNTVGRFMRADSIGQQRAIIMLIVPEHGGVPQRTRSDIMAYML